jgi:hypothetical protein
MRILQANNENCTVVFKESTYKDKISSLLESGVYVEDLEELALDIENYKPAKWLRYIDDTFVIRPAKLEQCLHHLNSVKPTIKFTMQVNANDTLPFMDVLVMKRGPKLAMKVYWKPTHTGRYLHFKSNHPYHVTRGVVHSLVGRTKGICQNQKDFNNKICCSMNIQKNSLTLQ